MFPFHTVQSINEDTSRLTQIEQMCKCVLFVKTRRFYSFTVNSQLKLKKKTILETFIREILIRNLTRFHGALFEIKILETFATAFFVKIYYLDFFASTAERSPSKRKQNLKNLQATSEFLDMVRDRKKTLKKEKEKREMRNS